MIKAFDVAYFMISVDTLEQNTKFAKQENADFPLLADPTQQTANQYGVLRDFGGDLGKLANRWTFYIGPDGKILAIDTAIRRIGELRLIQKKIAAGCVRAGGRLLE